MRVRRSKLTKSIIVAVGIAVILLLGGAGFVLDFPTSAERFETSDKTTYLNDDVQTIFSIPVETGTFAYDNLNRDEAIPFGPNSIFFTDEGNVLVGNWVDNTATELSLTGDLINRVKFSEASAINDVRKIHGRYYALDRTADGTQVVSDIGERTKTQKNTFRFSAGDASAQFGEIATTDLEGRERALDKSKRQRPDQLVISAGRPFDADANSLKIWRGKTMIAEWKAANPIAETRLLGSLPNGEFFVMIYEMIGADRILFDQRVIRFDASGNVLAMARVPQDQFYNIANDAALAADGNVYILMPREKSLDVLRLNFWSELPDLTYPESKEVLSEPEAAVASLSRASTTRSQIHNVANYYFTTWTNIPASRITGTCRVKPSYLTTGQAYASVPYSWGGWDSPLDLLNKMSGSTVYLAGHVADYNSSCARIPAGVDCSGFVGQAWANPGHPFSTRNVVSSGYANVIDWSQLRKGDGLVIPGHMLLYVSGKYGNSFSTWEATAAPGAHRALAWSRSWSDIRNYTPIRYVGLSVTNPTARMSASSPGRVQYENSSGLYYVTSSNGSIGFTFDAARSVSNGGSIQTWKWKINGTEVSQSSRFNYTLGRGNHTVTLTVTNTDGGISTASLIISINLR
jgi:cell wall-associated NlpC family hydrolase